MFIMMSAEKLTEAGEKPQRSDRSAGLGFRHAGLVCSCLWVTEQNEGVHFSLFVMLKNDAQVLAEDDGIGSIFYWDDDFLPFLRAAEEDVTINHWKPVLCFQ